MPPSGSRPSAAELLARANNALHGLELEPGETAAVLDFANQEVPHLQTPETSYLVLGSFREPFIRRVRVVENELNRRVGTYAFVLGDLRDLDIDRLPTFRIRFLLIASFADAIAAVFEQDAGGEVTELGTISETPFFEDSYVLPRDYAWLTERRLASEDAVIAAAVRVVSSTDLDENETAAELTRLLEAARQNGLDLSEAYLRERVEARLDDGPDVASYSWVQLNEFRLFELHDRCFPWTTAEELRSAVKRIP